jgi:hypothetical protein
MYRFAFLALVLSSCAMAQEKTCIDGKKHYRVGIRHIEKGGIGYEDGYTTLETFLASDPSQWSVTPFLDARGHVFNNGKWAVNVGAGLRTLWRDRAYGINTYYDYRNTNHLSPNQIGVGLETLGALFDFRINGYLPVGAKISNPYPARFSGFSGNSLLLLQKYKSAMKGADAEFGFHFAKSRLFDFYATAGPYYFIGQKARPIWGGKARVAGTFKDILTAEISDSYDRTFHNKFQGQVSLNFSFGPKSKIQQQWRTCKLANTLNDRMLQPVGRQEIIVIDQIRKKNVAIDPATGLPYVFVFVDNTSHSSGTYESPYPTLAQAQDNSSANNIIYVFPGDGTTTGMDSGITLQPSQKFWGSGISHAIQTTAGMISIPAQSNTNPIITNTNIDTLGNAVILSTNNAISGFTITSALNDAIFGADAQNLEISSCSFQNSSTFAIEASFSGDASITVTNNEFSSNINGVFLTLNGTSNVVFSDNTFENQTSISSVPIEIAANNNTFVANIENNLFNNNTTGTVRVSLNSVVNSDLTLVSNTITNNGTGSQSSLASSLTILASGTTSQSTITLNDNTFSGNTSNALYLDTSGQFTNLDITTSNNTMSNIGGSGIVVATPVDTLTLIATNNTMTGLDDNAIAVIASGLTTTGNVSINNNTITNIGNSSNGISLNQDFTTLNLTIQNNEINGCEGTGIISFAPDGVDSFTLNVSGNTISNCQNLSSNAAPGLDIEQYTNLTGSVINNTLSGNTGTAVFIGSTLTNPTACLNFTGNSSSTDYSLSNPGSGTFNLSPCNVDAANVGTINTSGTIDLVQSCSNPTPCPP